MNWFRFAPLFALIILASCDEWEFCGKGTANKCCKISYGDSDDVSMCVSQCKSCIDVATESGGTPSCPDVDSGWHNIKTPAGCVTGKRKKKYLFAEADQPLMSTPRVILATFTESPLDCQAVCSSVDPSRCASSTAEDQLAASMKTLKAEAEGTESGEITVARMRDIFKVTPEQDACERSSTRFSGGSVMNRGPGECTIKTPLSIGAKEIEISLIIPKLLSGEFDTATGYYNIEFLEKDRSAEIEIDDALMQGKYGGHIQYVRAASDRIYFSTERSCIALNLE